MYVHLKRRVTKSGWPCGQKVVEWLCTPKALFRRLAVAEAAKTLGYSEVREHQVVDEQFFHRKDVSHFNKLFHKSCFSLRNDSFNLINFSMERTHGTLHK